MSKFDFSKVRLVIGDPNRDLRQGLVSILRNHGFTDVVHTANLDVVLDAIQRDKVDLLVCDAELEGTKDMDFCAMVYKIRHNRMEANPFIVIQTLVSSPSPELARKISKAGVDDLVVKPITAGKIAERIVTLTRSRKEFVVTTDYVGPDRRSRHREGSQEIETIDVPNPVKVRATDGDLDEMNEAANAALKLINEQKVERHAFQIDYLVNQIIPAYEQGKINKETIASLEKLALVAQDIGKRMKSTPYAHVEDLCSSILDVAVRIRRSVQRPDPKDLELLPNLAMAVNLAFNENPANASIAQDISKSVINRVGA